MPQAQGEQSSDDRLKRSNAGQTRAVRLDIDVSDEHGELPFASIRQADPADAATTALAIHHATEGHVSAPKPTSTGDAAADGTKP